jgi:hypothetical protein
MVAQNMPLAPSIDNFLHTHRHDKDIVTIGKIAIARAILRAERNSYLYQHDMGRYSIPSHLPELVKSWHFPFWHTLISGVTLENLSEIFSNVSFIVFNYDRCLEHFLYLSLQSYFNLDPLSAANLVRSATIIHPYGKVGGLPWEDDGVEVEFGDDMHKDLFAVADEILTFTESANEGVIQKIKKAIKHSESMALLGFGFLDQNIELMTTQSDITRVFMTAYDLSPSDDPIALRKIGRMIGRTPETRIDTFLNDGEYEPHIVHGTCSKLWSDHKLRLPDYAPV